MKAHWSVLLVLTAASVSGAPGANQFREDARAIEAIVNDNYAYLERLPGGSFALTRQLRREAEQVKDKRELVRFAERALALLADHHAITGASMKDSWAVFPSYGDLWIERRGPDYVVEQVRRGSPAEAAGILAGDRLVAVDDVPVGAAVQTFWADLGTSSGGERDGFAARVLAAGRRDRDRILTIQRRGSEPRTLKIPNLYAAQASNRSPISVAVNGSRLVIRFNDSLGDTATIAAFDAAMARAQPRQSILLDLSDTGSGGNTTVARAILGWFVSRPTPYQIHNLPAEQRRTGVPRQWVEQVLPRPGKRHQGPVSVTVGRWTGSMGEGLAIGFSALGARVEGSRMAGLLGAIYDHPLPHSGLVLKIPTERLYAVDGTPREKFVPMPPARRH